MFISFACTCYAEGLTLLYVDPPLYILFSNHPQILHFFSNIGQKNMG